MKIPRSQFVEDGELYNLSRRNDKYIATIYKDKGWKECSLFEMDKYIVKTITADTIEDIRSLIAEALAEGDKTTIADVEFTNKRKEHELNCDVNVKNVAIVQALNLTLSHIQVARNLNTYRMARPNEAFWNEWKKNKTALKEAGVSVFKRNGKFFIALYDGNKSTQEAYEQQEAEHFARLIGKLQVAVLGCNADDKDIDKAYEIISSAKVYSDFAGLNDLIFGAEQMITDAEDELFFELVR